VGHNLGQNLNERPCVRSQLFVVRWASNRASVPTVMQFTFTRLVCAAIKHARSPRSLMGGSAQSEGDFVVSRMRQRWTGGQTKRMCGVIGKIKSTFQRVGILSRISQSR